jgi:hypothetical protein
MAQTTSTKDRQPSIKKYNRYSRVKQRIVWLYYKGIQTNNQEGIAPTGVVGGVTDRESEASLLQCFLLI